MAALGFGTCPLWKQPVNGEPVLRETEPEESLVSYALTPLEIRASKTERRLCGAHLSP